MSRPRRRRSDPSQTAESPGMLQGEKVSVRTTPSQVLASPAPGTAGQAEPARAKRKRRPRGKGKVAAQVATNAQIQDDPQAVSTPPPQAGGSSQAGTSVEGTPSRAQRSRQRKRGRRGGSEASASNGAIPQTPPKDQGNSKPRSGQRTHGEGKGPAGPRTHGEGKGPAGPRTHGEGKGQGRRKVQDGVRSRRVGAATRTPRVSGRNQNEPHTRPGSRPRPAMRPRPANEPIEPRSHTGAFGESWWARRWIDVLESFGFGGRIQRGWSYARSGAVLDVDVSQGRVVARVQGSRTTPYKVSIAVIPLSNAQWERAIDAMADQAIFTAKLLAGEMPREIEQAFATARVSLFPQSVHDLQTDCSCPDYANPCKHVAAVYYLLGERFDSDPFLIFELRGRSKDKIIAGLRARRADTTTDEPLPVVLTQEPQSLVDLLANFDQPGPEFAQIAPQIAAPTVASAMLRRYGPSPAETTNDLHNAYLLMTKATIERLFAE